MTAPPIYNDSPAFPRLDGWEDHNNGNGSLIASGGLTKREIFAGLAMLGLLSRYENPLDADEIIEASVDYADGLIVELNTREGHAP